MKKMIRTFSLLFGLFALSNYCNISFASETNVRSEMFSSYTVKPTDERAIEKELDFIRQNCSKELAQEYNSIIQQAQKENREISVLVTEFGNKRSYSLGESNNLEYHRYDCN